MLQTEIVVGPILSAIPITLLPGAIGEINNVLAANSALDVCWYYIGFKHVGDIVVHTYVKECDLTAVEICVGRVHKHCIEH